MGASPKNIQGIALIRFAVTYPHLLIYLIFL